MERQKLHLLAVVAHPHDFMHCCGTFGVHTAMGDTATIVSLMSGASTPHNEKLSVELAKPPEDRDPEVMGQTWEQLAEIKKQELRDVAAIFGITDVRVFDYPDHPFYLRDHPKAIEQLVDVMLEVRPHVLVTQTPFTSGAFRHSGQSSGAHNDHNETAYAALEARAQAGAPQIGVTRRPHKIAAIYYLGLYFDRSRWDFCVDISEFFEKKVQAEALFLSQGHTPERARRSVELNAGHTGRYGGGVKYAESFVKDTHELLPHFIVPEAALKRAENPVV